MGGFKRQFLGRSGLENIQWHRTLPCHTLDPCREPHLLQIRRRPTTSSRPTSNTLVQLALLPSQPLSSALSQGWQPNLDEAEATRQLQRWRSYGDRTASSQMGRTSAIPPHRLYPPSPCLDDSDSYSASDVAIWTRGCNL